MTNPPEDGEPTELVVDIGAKIVGIVPKAFRIAGPEGRVLLEVGFDGTVTGEIDDAGEAAKIFADELRRCLSPGGGRMARRLG